MWTTKWKKNLSQEFRLKNTEETKIINKFKGRNFNHFLEEIKQIELMSRKQNKVCATLNYVEKLF